VTAGKFSKSVVRVGENNHRGADVSLEAAVPWQVEVPHQKFKARVSTSASVQSPFADVVDVTVTASMPFVGL